jgi:hypothetical protein
LVSKLGRAFDGICEIVGLRRKTIVIVIERRSVIVNQCPLLLIPMSRKQQDGLWMRKMCLDVQKLIVKKGVLFFIDKRHGSSSVSDKI